MDLKEGLNHPLAVVAILIVIFQFIGWIVKEGIAFFKRTEPSEVTNKLDAAMDKLAETLNKVSDNLAMMNAQLKYQEEIHKMRHDALQHEVREVKKLLESGQNK